jgi:hypothetical protein
MTNAEVRTELVIHRTELIENDENYVKVIATNYFKTGGDQFPKSQVYHT